MVCVLIPHFINGLVEPETVASQFEKSWRSTAPCPEVRAVYKIVSTKLSLEKYEDYKSYSYPRMFFSRTDWPFRSSIEARGHFVNKGRSLGNENRRWHGTKRQCSLGDKDNTKLCSSTNCPLCCIIRTSYDLSFFGKKSGWGRFGCGIYTSSTSSK